MVGVLPSSLDPARGQFADALNQSSQHSFCFRDARLYGLELLGRNKAQIFRKQDVVFKFTSRAKCDVKELTHFSVRSTATTFSDICGDRKSRSSHVANQAENHTLRRDRSEVIHAQSHSMTLLPNLKLGVILHIFSRPMLK